MKVLLALIAVAILCSPGECRNDFDCDPGCFCSEEGICSG